MTRRTWTTELLSACLPHSLRQRLATRDGRESKNGRMTPGTGEENATEMSRDDLSLLIIRGSRGKGSREAQSQNEDEATSHLFLRRKQTDVGLRYIFSALSLCLHLMMQGSRSEPGNRYAFIGLRSSFFISILLWQEKRIRLSAAARFESLVLPLTCLICRLSLFLKPSL